MWHFQGAFSVNKYRSCCIIGVVPPAHLLYRRRFLVDATWLSMCVVYTQAALILRPEVRGRPQWNMPVRLLDVAPGDSEGSPVTKSKSRCTSASSDAARFPSRQWCTVTNIRHIYIYRYMLYEIKYLNSLRSPFRAVWEVETKQKRHSLETCVVPRLLHVFNNLQAVCTNTTYLYANSRSTATQKM